MLKDFGGIGLIMIVAFIFPFTALIASSLVQTRRLTNEKLSPYECGMDTIGKTWVQFKTSYFLYALAFVVFDVETVFIYPWAVKFQQLGLAAFVEMFVFIGILLVALVYAWKKGALAWK